MNIEDFSNKRVRTAAETAAHAFIKAPPESDVVFSRKAVYHAGGFLCPNDDDRLDKSQYERWKLAEMRFIEQWRALLAEQTGRWARTIPGEGFQLLTKEDTINHGAKYGYEYAARALDKGTRIMEYASPWGLDIETRTRQKALVMHQRGLAAAARNAARDTRHQMGFAATGTEDPRTPKQYIDPTKK